MDRYGSSQGHALDSASVLIHTEPVASLATIQPGLCLSGSKDKVGIFHELHREKTCLWGFRAGRIQTRLYNHRRWLEY